MSLPLEKMSAAAVGRALAAGGLEPVAVAEFFLDRIEKNRANPAFIAVTAERARREAMASAKRYKEGRPLGPLDGVPVAWKDLMDMAGTLTTAGSALYRDAPPKSADAAVVANLAAAGMVAVGKTNLSEFAFSGIGLNPTFGTPYNPHDAKTKRIVGGSSSGAAVTVSAGLAPCAIGSDTGGSIRGPCSLTGITGVDGAQHEIGAGPFPGSHRRAERPRGLLFTVPGEDLDLVVLARGGDDLQRAVPHRVAARRQEHQYAGAGHQGL